MVTIDRIRDLSKRKGVKLKFLTDALGLNPSYFSNVDTGKSKISLDRISAIAELLGTTPEYLLGQTDNPNPQKSPCFNFDRYEQRRIARGLTPNYVERIIGIRYDTMEEVEGGLRTLTDEEVTRLAILLDTTYEYLMGLTDDPRVPLDDRTGVKIKVFGEVAAGIPIQQIDNFDPDDVNSWEEIDRRTAKSGTYFALRIKGDSMEPRIYNGDVVIVRQQESVDNGDIAVVAINGDSATCKKVMHDQNGGMFLMSLNAKYAPRYFNADQIEHLPVSILGKVVELRGKL